MANLSQSELRTKGRTTSSKSENIPEIIPSDDYIESQRNIIKQSESEAKQVLSKATPKTSSLRSGIYSRQQLSKLKQVKEKTKDYLKQLGESKESFESEVSEKLPERATPEKYQESLSKARTELQSVIKSTKESINLYSKREEKYKDKGNKESAREYKNKAEEKTEYLKVFEDALNNLNSSNPQSVASTLKQYYSGYIKDKANYEEDLEKYHNERSKQKSQVPIQPTTPTAFIDPKTGLGYSILPEYAKQKGYVPESEYIKPEQPKQITNFVNLPKSLNITDFIGKDKLKIPQLPKSSPIQQGTYIPPPFNIEQDLAKQEAKYQGSFEHLKDLSIKGIKKYEEKVITPLGESKIFKGYEEKVVKPTSKYITDPTFETIKKSTKGIYDVSLPTVTYITSIPYRIKNTKETKDKSIEGLYKAFTEKKSKDIIDFTKTPIGDIARAKKIIDQLPPEQEIVIGTAGTKRTVQAGTLQDKGFYQFSKDVILGEVEETFTRIGERRGIEKPELFGKGVALTTEFAPYLVGGVLETDIGIKMLEASSGGKLGGEKNVVEYATKNPFDIAFLGGGAVFKGVKTLKATGKEPVIFNKKYLDYLKSEETKIKAVSETTSKSKTIPELGIEYKSSEIAKDLSKVGTKDMLKVDEIITKQKGKITLTEELPTKEFKGTITEKIKGKQYKGDVEIADDFYKATINLDKDLKKITTITKDKTRVEILKGQKPVFAQELKQIKSLPELTKSKLTKFKSAVSNIFKEDELTKAINLGLSGEIKTGKSTAGGFKLKSRTSTSLTDISKLTPQQQIAYYNNKIQRIKTRPSIEYVEASEKTIPKDITLFKQVGQDKRQLKFIESKLNRRIAKKTEQEFELSFGKDIKKALNKEKSKLNKELKSKSNIQKKEITKELKSKRSSELRKANKELIESYNKQTNNMMQQLSQGLKPKQVTQPRQVVKPSYYFKGTSKFDLPEIVQRIPSSPIQQFSLSSKIASVPMIKQFSLSTGKVLSQLGTSLKTESKLNQQSMTKQLSKLDSLSKQESKLNQQSVTKQLQRQTQITKQMQRPRQRQDEKLRSEITQFKIPNIKIVPKLPIKPLIPSLERQRLISNQSSKVPSLKKEEKFYIPEAKRNNQWVKLSDVGLTELSAKGRGSRAVDETTAGRFRITETSSGDPQVVDNYFVYNKDKFRDYKINKGQKIPLKNTFIEKKGTSRIDTQSEKEGLTIAKWLKKQGYAGRSRPTKLTPNIKSKLRVPAKGLI